MISYILLYTRYCNLDEFIMNGPRGWHAYCIKRCTNMYVTIAARRINVFAYKANVFVRKCTVGFELLMNRPIYISSYLLVFNELCLNEDDFECDRYALIAGYQIYSHFQFRTDFDDPLGDRFNAV